MSDNKETSTLLKSLEQLAAYERGEIELKSIEIIPSIVVKESFTYVEPKDKK